MPYNDPMRIIEASSRKPMRHHRFIAATVVIILLGFMSIAGLAHGNDLGKVTATIGNAHVTISYGRPKLNGRDPLQLIKPGEYWRMGADVPTTIQSDADLSFGGTRVPKGRHILIAHYIAPGQWSLVVSNASAMQYKPSAKLAEVPAQFETSADSSEEVTIQLSDQGVIQVAWGTLRLQASFTAAE